MKVGNHAERRKYVGHAMKITIYVRPKILAVPLRQGFDSESKKKYLNSQGSGENMVEGAERMQDWQMGEEI